MVHVERALAALEPRDRLALDVLLEVRSGHVGLVAGLVGVLLVEEEDARVFRRAMGLVEDTTGLLARQGRHRLEDLEDPVLLSLLAAIRGRDNVGHLSVSLRSDCVPEDTDALHLELNDITLAEPAIELDSRSACRRPRTEHLTGIQTLRL